MDELKHYGVKGMHWGVRRYQNYDGTRIGATRRLPKPGKPKTGKLTKKERQQEAATNYAVERMKKKNYSGSSSKEIMDDWGKYKKEYKNQVENDQLRSKMDEWDRQRERHNKSAEQFWKDIDNGVDWDKAQKLQDERDKDFYVKKPFRTKQSKATLAYDDLKKFAKQMSIDDVNPDLLKRAKKYEIEFKDNSFSEGEVQERTILGVEYIKKFGF